MKILLFPDEFLQRERCFGLFKSDTRDPLDTPVTIAGDAGVPIHVVHSDPDHVAYLVGLIVLQAWTMGLDDESTPPPERRPVLVATSRPGRFADSYLRLQIPVTELQRLSNRRRVRLFQTTGKVTNVRERAEHWDYFIKSAEQRTRLHNFFPAFVVGGAHGIPRLIESRQNLGRGDQAGPAVLIARHSDAQGIQTLLRRFALF